MSAWGKGIVEGRINGGTLLRGGLTQVEVSGTQLMQVEVELIFPVPLLLFWSGLQVTYLARSGTNKPPKLVNHVLHSPRKSANVVTMKASAATVGVSIVLIIVQIL
jgi:hypothetical protein